MRIFLYQIVMTALTCLNLSFSAETHMWWAEGYPYGAHVKDGRKPLRVLQSNNFALVLNTETLQIEHFGLRHSNASYIETSKNFSQNWTELPAVELELSYIVDGEKFTAVGANPPSHPGKLHIGPRLIESGRFWQRGDVWMINFRGKNGKVVTKNCHLEIGAWSDQIILTAKLAEKKGDGEILVNLKSGDQHWLGKGELKGGKGVASIHLAVVGNEIKQKIRPNLTPILVSAKEDRDKELATYSTDFQAHIIDLSALRKPTLPRGASENDYLIKCPVLIKNTGEIKSQARLAFEYARGENFQTRHGVPITGVSAVLCDDEGRPTGIPIQLSKNWHKDGDYGDIPNDSAWFRALTCIELEPGEVKRYEIRIFHAHWGGLPAASHAQLSLIGWGTNQLWEQSALGAWGETICYEPTRAHRDSFITDVRPLMISSKNGKDWGWAHNMGGADFLRLERPDGSRISSRQVRGTYLSPGPCLTDTRYTGVLGDHEASFEIQTALARTDDFSRATYRVILDVHKDIELSRSAIFQLGADRYNDPLDKKIAWGNLKGVTREEYTEKMANAEKPVALSGNTPWVSMHDTQRLEKHGDKGGIATRGIIIHQWKATIGGKQISPHLDAKTSPQGHVQSEVVLPNEITTLRKGDQIVATIELLLPPKAIDDYYGKNQEFIAKAKGHLNKWEIIADNAIRHQHTVTVKKGRLVQTLPDIRVKADNNQAVFEVQGDHYKYTAVTITGLSKPTAGQLKHNGKPLQQEIHGHDYYQVNYDSGTKTWSKTFNIKFAKPGKHLIEFL